MKLSSKIFNDPIYGFIRIPHGIIFELIEHPYFQRLRRITQLGLSYLVYPGAYHTRFQHAIGATYLISKAVQQLRNKGHKITEKEDVAVSIAILLHDIGHGAFSHALEHSIAHEISHEDLSLLFMEKLNNDFNGQLTTAIKIFKNEYPKRFLHQLVSSQLDMDRMDYLKRDSFYSGVQEGIIGSDRIIHMLNVVKDELVVESKGIYSIEKFLIARRLMYWQVYLHKTVLSAENMLIKVLKRAKELSQSGEELFGSSALKLFLKNNFTLDDFRLNEEVFKSFTRLDDQDVLGAIKEWQFHEDKILATLSNKIINRKLLKIEVTDKAVSKTRLTKMKKQVADYFNIDISQTHYLAFEDSISNNAYTSHKSNINILYKDGSLKDIADASDQLNISALSKPVKKHFFCYPEECKL
ncbi:MAG: phosphohydrolase [Flavobacteriales bacterium]|nr:phosphohydrolase [Flavobacteriales bacterium]